MKSLQEISNQKVMELLDNKLYYDQIEILPYHLKNNIYNLKILIDCCKYMRGSAWYVQSTRTTFGGSASQQPTNLNKVFCSINMLSDLLIDKYYFNKKHQESISDLRLFINPVNRKNMYDETYYSLNNRDFNDGKHITKYKIKENLKEFFPEPLPKNSKYYKLFSDQSILQLHSDRLVLARKSVELLLLDNYTHYGRRKIFKIGPLYF